MKMTTQIKQTLTLILLLTSFSAFADNINIINPWVRAAPQNAPALAAFMKIENNSDSDRSVVEVKTTMAVDRVELHRTKMSGGMMKMIPQKVIPIKAGSSTLLKPGSWHIMLIKPTTVPKMGDTVHLTVVFDNGSEQSVMANVKKGMKMKMKMDHSKMKHD